MRHNYIKGRRNFLKASLCIPGVYGLNILSNTRDDYVMDKYCLEALIQVMKDQASKHDYTIYPEQINNLSYAFKKIKPANHQEMAFAVAYSGPIYSQKYVVDEYLRRKNGKQSKGPDHPILALDNWCVPNTYRIIIFKEQIHALCGEVTNYSLTPHRLWVGINYKTIELNDFHELLNDEYRNQLSKDEVKIIFEAISYVGQGGCRLYSWCSSIVSRADALTKTRI